MKELVRNKHGIGYIQDDQGNHMFLSEVNNKGILLKDLADLKTSIEELTEEQLQDLIINTI